MLAILIYALLCTACFYLGSRAKITGWLWSRYPKPFARFMDCAACSGFWYGVIAALVLRLDTGILRGRAWTTSISIEPIGVGLMMLVLTPVVAGIMQRGLETVGSAIEES